MRKKVLIIDNEPDLLEVLEVFLTGEGFAVITSTCTTHVQQLIKKYKPDLIVLDYIHHREWGTNGNTLYQQIKNNPKTRHLPVVLASASSKVLQLSEDYSYDRFIAKPFDLIEFCEYIKEAFSHYRQNYSLINRWFNKLKLAA